MIKRYWVYLGRDDEPCGEGALSERISVETTLDLAKQAIVDELINLSCETPKSFKRFVKILEKAMVTHWFLIFDAQQDENVFNWKDRSTLLSTKYFISQ